MASKRKQFKAYPSSTFSLHFTDIPCVCVEVPMPFGDSSSGVVGVGVGDAGSVALFKARVSITELATSSLVRCIYF
jgi:hypothetical protein